MTYDVTDEWTKLKDVKYPDNPNESLDNWQKIFTPKFCIFFKPNGKEICGFEFVCVERITFATHDENWSANEYIKYSWYGVAYFDGIRHLYANTDNGYINYIDIDMQIEILTELKKLDEKYCRE